MIEKLIVISIGLLFIALIGLSLYFARYLIELGGPLVELERIKLLMFKKRSKPPTRNDRKNIRMGPVFVVSLPFRKDRRASIEEQFSKENIEFTFFDAIYGKEVDRQTISNDITTQKVKQKNLDGQIGAILSYHKLFSLIEDEKLDNVMIFEDDALLEPDFSRLYQQYLTEVPADYDILYLGSMDLDSPPKIKNIREYVSPHVVRPFQAISNYGFVLSLKGCKKILHQLFPLQNNLDLMLSRAIRMKKLKAYCFYPNLCRHNYYVKSDIRDNNTIFDPKFKAN